MIKDNLANAKQYYNLSDGIKEGLLWIKNTDLKNIPDGKYKLNDINYANVQTYNTKEDAHFEAHREYIDIQFMINGSEICEIGEYKSVETIEEYNAEKDIEIFNIKKYDRVSLNENEFLILYPQDAHKPSINNGSQKQVKKVVVKIHI